MTERGTPSASSPAALRRMQSARQRDTKPELMLRSALHRRGLRFFVNRAPLPTLRRRADVVFPRLRVAVYVDGCFWHSCPIHGWERRFDLAPLRRSQLAPPPSDWQPTVRCSWSSSRRRRKEWDHEWRRSSRSEGTGTEKASRSGRWRSVMVFTGGRCVRRWPRRCRQRSEGRLVVLRRSWGRIGG